MTTTKDKSTGFTLIELLVVIAIIGILASIILVALNETRAKARQASAKGALKHAESGMEIAYHNNLYSYANVCPTDVATPVAGAQGNVLLRGLSGVANAFGLVLTGGGGAGDNYDTNNGSAPNAIGDVGCQTDADEYMLQVYLDTGVIMCIDENGFAGEIAVAKATNLGNGFIKCN